MSGKNDKKESERPIGTTEDEQHGREEEDPEEGLEKEHDEESQEITEEEKPMAEQISELLFKAAGLVPVGQAMVEHRLHFQHLTQPPAAVERDQLLRRAAEAQANVEAYLFLHRHIAALRNTQGAWMTSLAAAPLALSSAAILRVLLAVFEAAGIELHKVFEDLVDAIFEFHPVEDSIGPETILDEQYRKFRDDTLASRVAQLAQVYDVSARLRPRQLKRFRPRSSPERAAERAKRRKGELVPDPNAPCCSKALDSENPPIYGTTSDEEEDDDEEEEEDDGDLREVPCSSFSAGRTSPPHGQEQNAPRSPSPRPKSPRPHADQ